ncbi:hypothetical protein [Streptomyces sp. NPDC093600]|uniref:SPW repeat domain-containing protein n=1 Tax=Streptomyces sp. NPDC093600 TaxID=3366047 RepID=UPI00380F1A20
MSSYSHHHVTRDQETAERFRHALHDELLTLPMLLAAVALTVGPFVSQLGPKDAQVNEALVGLILLFVVGRRLYRGSGLRSDIVVGVLGAWMIASPFVLDLQNTAVAEGNWILDLTAGSVLVVFAGASMLTMRQRREGAGHSRVTPR